MRGGGGLYFVEQIHIYHKQGMCQLKTLKVFYVFVTKENKQCLLSVSCSENPGWKIHC